MKHSTASTLFATLALSVIAANAIAANPNGRKPKCPPGQIATLEQGQYQCKPLGIQAQGTSKEQRRATAPKIKKAVFKLPDYTILGAKRVQGTTHTFAVKVKNKGVGKAQANHVFGVHYYGNNQSWGADAIVPALNPGQTKVINITIPPQNYTRGDRIKFTVDNFKHVVESNENKNTYAMNYK